ncbi:MAG: hypothetical protein GY795_18555 [Desulfobacterales bacterium]|nr:hypothetical protein [Desulfobacterales bacterium]
MKPFAKWTIEEVEDTFGVTLQKQSKILEQWLTVRSSPSRESADQLDRLREKLTDHVWDWNELELTVKFIGPLLSIVNFDQENYQSFMNRDISVSYEQDTLGGTVDFVVAGGKRSPKKPFFFIHEHKRKKDSSNDPLGQVMIAMVAAQKINNDGNPVYGAYVMGRYWNFVVLKGLEYSVSLTYDATKNELNDILGILENTKKIIEELVEKN